MRSIALVTSFSCLAALLLQSARAQDAPEAEIKTLWVAHYLVDCDTGQAGRCYLIKEGQYDEWQLLDIEIEGLDYEEGFAYEIRVVEEQVEESVAGAYRPHLRLDRVVTKIEAFSSPPARPGPPDAPGSAAEKHETNALPVAAPEPSLTMASTETTEEQTWRGHLTIGHGLEARSFRACGTELGIWVEDASGRLWRTYRELAGKPNQPIYLMVSGSVGEPPAVGFGAHYEAQLTVTELRHASAEPGGCDEDLTTFQFSASGNEPAWKVTVASGGITFSEPSSPARLLFPHRPPGLEADRIVYRGVAGDRDPRHIQVTLIPTPCTDTISGSRFSYRATVVLDDRRFEGCALQGLQSP